MSGSRSSSAVGSTGPQRSVRISESRQPVSISNRVANTVGRTQGTHEGATVRRTLAVLATAIALAAETARACPNVRLSQNEGHGRRSEVAAEMVRDRPYGNDDRMRRREHLACPDTTPDPTANRPSCTVGTHCRSRRELANRGRCRCPGRAPADRCQSWGYQNFLWDDPRRRWRFGDGCLSPGRRFVLREPG